MCLWEVSFFFCSLLWQQLSHKEYSIQTLKNCRLGFQDNFAVVFFSKEHKLLHISLNQKKCRCSEKKCKIFYFLWFKKIADFFLEMLMFEQIWLNLSLNIQKMIKNCYKFIAGKCLVIMKLVLITLHLLTLTH